MNRPTSRTRRFAAPRLLACSATMLLAGVAAGFVWLGLAHPAEWEVRAGGIVQSEAASRGQFSVIVVFVIIGAIVSLVWGWAAAWALPDLGWFAVPLVVVVTLLSAVIAWRVGVMAGPPDPASVTGVSIGDKIPAELKIDGLAPFLVWPILGLMGLLGATWSARRFRTGVSD